MKKVLRFLGNTLITIVLVLSIVMTIAVVTSSRSSRVKLPNLFGYALLTVQSDSMESDSGFFTGDLIVDKILSEEEANQLSVGDVISFIRAMDGQEYLETHRIVACDDPMVPKDEIKDGIWVRGDTRYYTTMGDNTPGIDKLNGGFEIEYTSYTKIYGIWTGIRIPKLGTALDFLQSSMGFMICVVLPVALFFIYQLYIFIMTLTRSQKEKALEEVSSKEEELKQKAIAEFLAKQQADGGSTADADTKPAAEETPAATESKSKKKGKNKKEAEEEAKPAEEEPAAETNSEEETESEEEEKPAEETKSDKKSKSKKKDKSEKKEAPEKKDEPEDDKDEDKDEDADDDEDDEEKSEDGKSEEKSEDETKKASVSTDDISEEEKNRIIQEYLAKQAKEKKE